MIELKVENYCHDCADFTPTIDNYELETFDGTIEVTTNVLCKFKKRCAAVERYLRKELSKGDVNVSGKNSEDDCK